MTKRAFVGLGIVLFSLVVALHVQAQEIATLVLRNGERPSGELIDLNASGFIMRIGGQDRRISPNDVASVEFAVGPLPGDAQARVNAGQALVLLRSGQVVDGRLSDIGGARPLRLTIDTASGQREFTSNEVAQVHLHPLNQAAAVATGGQSATAAPAGAITVPANQPWTDTGMTVRRGDRVSFAGSGDVNLGNNASSGVGGSPAVTNPSLNYPLRGAFAGVLIGKVGTGAPFLIGANTQPIEMPNNGRLLLGVNDDHVADNSGNYVVTIQTTSVRRR
jgi:hypothetical protein